jgi:hypothetical protein
MRHVQTVLLRLLQELVTVWMYQTVTEARVAMVFMLHPVPLLKKCV